MMTTLTDFMSTDHKQCDVAFALAEEASLDGRWEQGKIAFDAFKKEMARHFHREEEMLFPALLQCGGPVGPVQVMRMEHAQMNDLIAQLEDAVNSRNMDEYGGISETLLIVMQQHNLKEEQILYPIADRILAEGRCDLIDQLQSV